MMAQPPNHAPEYVAARRILLNALITLQPHRDAVIVAGAQAIYLHTGAAELDEAIAPFTTDGDLAVNPSLLADDPQLEAAMQRAGFQLKVQTAGHTEPGIWVAPTTIGSLTYEVPVDLIVPEGVAGPGGRRAARLPIHGNQAARRAIGLEAALIDHSPITITTLEPDDDRSITAEVAGVAAMFVAKAHKLHDRVNASRPNRLSDKDAADILRLMQSTDPTTVANRLAHLADDPAAGPVTQAAVSYLEDLFSRRNSPGIQLASRAMQIAVPAPRVQAISLAYMSALTETYQRAQQR